MLTCQHCGHRREGRIGDTCGMPVEARFVPLTDRQMAEAIYTSLTGVPLPSGHPANITRARCSGTLVLGPAAWEEAVWQP